MHNWNILHLAVRVYYKYLINKILTINHVEILTVHFVLNISKQQQAVGLYSYSLIKIIISLFFSSLHLTPLNSSERRQRLALWPFVYSIYDVLSRDENHLLHTDTSAHFTRSDSRPRGDVVPSSRLASLKSTKLS